MIYYVAMGSHTFEVRLGDDGVSIDGTPVEVDLAHVEGTSIHGLILDGASHRVVARRNGAGVWDLRLRGRRFQAEVLDQRAGAIRKMTGVGADSQRPRPVRAPMPGLVVKLEVEVGDQVAAGQGVVIVEAMKMQNELRAQTAGRVEKIHVADGDTVEKDQVLVDLAPLEEDM